MELVNECFDKVKKNYLKFLNKEKIYKKGVTVHVKNLKTHIYQLHFGLMKNIKKKEKLY